MRDAEGSARGGRHLTMDWAMDCEASSRVEHARRDGIFVAAAWGVVLAVVLALMLSGCATGQGPGGRAEAALDPGGAFSTEPYKVGPMTVWLRPQPEVEFLCRLRLANVGRNQRVMGCYLPDTHTIIAVADAQVLLHEFKHHFEGKFHR